MNEVDIEMERLRNWDSPAAAAKSTAVVGELEALKAIVDGFEVLPPEARSRVYSYLMSRYPGRLTP